MSCANPLESWLEHLVSIELDAVRNNGKIRVLSEEGVKGLTRRLRELSGVKSTKLIIGKSMDLLSLSFNIFLRHEEPLVLWTRLAILIKTRGYADWLWLFQFRGLAV